KHSGGFLLFFIDQDTVSVSDGPPWPNGWHRLDGPDITLLCNPGGSRNPRSNSDQTYPHAGTTTIHADPHVIATTAGLNFSLTDIATLPAPGATINDLQFVNANRVLNSQTCGAGVMLLGNDGGIYKSSDCGRS